MRQVPQVAICRSCGIEIERWSPNERWVHRDSGGTRCDLFARPTDEPLEGDDTEGNVRAIPIPLFYGEARVTAIRTEDRKEGWRVTLGNTEGLNLWFRELGFEYPAQSSMGFDFHLNELGDVRRGDQLTITIGRKQS